MNKVKRVIATGALVLALAGVGCSEQALSIRAENYKICTGLVQAVAYYPGIVSRGFLGTSYVLPVCKLLVECDRGIERVFTARGFDTAEDVCTFIERGDRVDIYEMPELFSGANTIGQDEATKDHFRKLMEEMGVVDMDGRLYVREVQRR